MRKKHTKANIDEMYENENFMFNSATMRTNLSEANTHSNIIAM